MMDNLKERLQEHKVQEAVAAAVKIVVPTAEVSPTTVPEVTSKGKNKERGLDSRAASSKPAKKKEKIPHRKLRSWN